MSSKLLYKILILSEVLIYSNPFEKLRLFKSEIEQLIKIVSLYLSGKVHKEVLIELENCTLKFSRIIYFFFIIIIQNFYLYHIFPTSYSNG